MMLTSVWFDRFVNCLSGLVIEVGIIIAQLVMVSAVWLVPLATIKLCLVVWL